MNKYKLVSLVLTVALLATLVRLVFQLEAQPDAQPINRAEVVFQNILARKSVRSFTDEPVRRSQLDTLLRAAMAAPTGRDMRPWKFIVLDERATMDTLAAQLPYAQMLKEAPAAI
ncbi:Nitroreductase-like protein, partial [gut metagenome]